MASTLLNSPPDSISQASVFLNHELSAALDLRGCVRNAHWNIGSGTSEPVARLFNEMMREIDQYMHLLFRRLTELGDLLNERAEFANFGERARNFQTLSTAAGDLKTAALFHTLSRMVDQQLWRATSVARHLHSCRAPSDPSTAVSRPGRAHDLRGRFAKRANTHAIAAE